MRQLQTGGTVDYNRPMNAYTGCISIHGTSNHRLLFFQQLNNILIGGRMGNSHTRTPLKKQLKYNIHGQWAKLLPQENCWLIIELMIYIYIYMVTEFKLEMSR